MADATVLAMPDIRPLHIGKFVPPPYAGVEAHVDTLLRCLQPQVQGTLLAAESPAGAAAHAGLPYRLLTARAYGKLASATLSPGVLSLARQELSSGRCNLLHIHAPNPWGDLAALACARDVPVVMSWHSDIVRQRQLMKVYQYIQRRVLRRADRIIVFTPRHYDSSAQLHQLDVAAKIAYVPMGIDFTGLDPVQADAAMAARLQAWAAGRPLLLTVGRHVSYKGYEHLLAAMARLRSEAVLVMVGAGVLTPALQQQARELGLAQRVLFLGEVERPALVAALHACDVFTLPSIAPSEAFGIASAEAMACGKPTIVCQLHNGVNYLNREGETSLVVPPRQVAALADAVDTLALDESLRRSMGGAASAWVRGEFSLDAMKQGTLSLYRSLY
ncbi:MAG: glycosyltransferase [Hylemonella sp.]|nr:glycosyltransferase [Hylemonella sp.]